MDISLTVNCIKLDIALLRIFVRYSRSLCNWHCGWGHPTVSHCWSGGDTPPGSTPLGAYIICAVYLFLQSPFYCDHTYTRSFIADRRTMVGTCSNGPYIVFYVHQSYCHDSTHSSLFTSWGALWHSSNSHLHQDCLKCDSCPNTSRDELVKVRYAINSTALQSICFWHNKLGVFHSHITWNHTSRSINSFSDFYYHCFILLCNLYPSIYQI